MPDRLVGIGEEVQHGEAVSQRRAGGIGQLQMDAEVARVAEHGPPRTRVAPRRPAAELELTGQQQEARGGLFLQFGVVGHAAERGDRSASSRPSFARIASRHGSGSARGCRRHEATPVGLGPPEARRTNAQSSR